MTFISNSPATSDPPFMSNFPVRNTKLPYVTVSSKGMSNGLSDIPNDGADFGPDTMLNTTSKNQYGPPYSQTSGIQEAINYVRSFANIKSAYLPEIHLIQGEYLVHQPIYLKYTSTNLPAEISQETGNVSAVSAPCLVGYGNVNGQSNYTPTGAVIKAASDFPNGEYLYALLLPTASFLGNGTNPQWVGGKLENIIFDCNNLAAGVMLEYFGNGTAERLSIRNPTIPNPTITKAPDNAGQSLQTGAFVYSNTIDSGEFTALSQIQIRGGAYEDGFVISAPSGGGQIIGENLWCAGGAQRYGFNVGCYNQFPIILINPECDINGGWTGNVPSTNPASPQSAGYYISTGAVKIINNNTFIGIQGNYPYIFNLGNLYIDGGYYIATGNQYVIVTSANTTVVENALIEYNSSSNGVFLTTFADNNLDTVQVFKNITYIDDNSGTPSYSPFNINWGSNPPWYSTIHIDPFFDNRGRFFGGYAPSITNPPVSGTVYQNQNPTKIRITLPVYASTAGTAGSVAVAMGYNQSGTNPPTIPTLFTKFINGSTSSTATELITIEVPAGWYYSFTGTNVTFGTATVEAI